MEVFFSTFIPYVLKLSARNNNIIIGNGTIVYEGELNSSCLWCSSIRRQGMQL